MTHLNKVLTSLGLGLGLFLFHTNLMAISSTAVQLSPNVQQAVIFPGLRTQYLILDKITRRLDILRSKLDIQQKYDPQPTSYVAGDLAGTCASLGPIFYTDVENQEPLNDLPGYNANLYGIGFAGDGTVASDLKVGVGLGVSYMIVEPNGVAANLGNSIKATTVQPLLYATWDPRPFFIDGLLSWSYNSYNSQRNIVFLNQRATANFNGMQFTTKLRVGMVVPAGPFDFTVPLIAFQGAKLKQKGYSEIGAASSNLAIQGQITQLSQFSLGAKIALVDYPQAGFYFEIHGAGLILTNGNFTPRVTATFITGGGVPFISQGAAPSREGYNVGGSMSLLFKECILFTAGYDFESFSTLTSNAPWARVRWLMY